MVETFLGKTTFIKRLREVCVRIMAILAVGLIGCLPVLSDSGQADLEVKDVQTHPFAVQFHAGSRLRLHLRSGDFRIVGRNEDKLTVRLEGRNADNAQDLAVRLRRSSNDADLKIWGGPKNELQVIIQVPASSMLYIRMPAGNLAVEGVSGDKDVELHAGDLSIAVGSAAEYGPVDASVVAGDLSASPFGEYHGGLFRSFEKHGSGKYKLHAHVGAGDLTLR